MKFDEILTSDSNLKIHINIYEGGLEAKLTTNYKIESFMWFGVDDDINILSNILKK